MDTFRLRHWALPVIILLLQGCSSFFFYPDRNTYSDPAQLNPHYQSLFLETGNGERIHAWWFPAKTENTKGSVLFFHGNAQNLSSHIVNLAWINNEGYNLMIFDYRGYGQSEGTPALGNALEDGKAAYTWFRRQQPPHYIVGQSLGGAIASGFLAQNPQLQSEINGLVLDAVFAGYQDIAREKLAALWLTWPLQYPLSWTMPQGPDPVEAVSSMHELPKLLIHSRYDEVIPLHHGARLYEAAAEPKQRWITETAHGYTFTYHQYRQGLLKFLEQQAHPD